MGEVQEEITEHENQQPVLDVDTFLDLNFVPQWARRPPNAVHAARFSDRDAESRDRRGRRPPRDAVGREDRGQGPRGRDEDRPRRPAAMRRGRAEPSRAEEPRVDVGAQRPDAPPVPVAHGEGGRPRHHVHAAGTTPQPDVLHVQFLPERKAVFELGKRVAGAHKAYPLLDLAGVLLAREGLCYVRLDVARPEEGALLQQCLLCRTVALDRAAIAEHIVADHLADYFDVETETVAPPAGVFVCVAICGLSGKLLGPPNHHSYTEAVKAMHAEHYGNMDLEHYRSKIRISHDSENVERWKASCTTRTLYRRKGDGDAAGEAMGQKEALQFMETEVVPARVKALRRVVLREGEAHAVRDPVIRAALHRAWQREVRFPIQMALALRAALRSRQLHVFKAGSGKGMYFVTAVKPAALNPALAVPAIREALLYLEKHPGCTREEMVHELIGDAPAEDPRVKELLQPISWLTDRGHIIEFFNGRLAVPRHM